MRSDCRSKEDAPVAEMPALFHGKGQWLHPVQVTAATVASRAAAPSTIEAVIGTLLKLEADDYLRFMVDYYGSGVAKFGGDWGYLDLLTVLQAAAALLQPKRYLEIGVRRGRSLAIVGQAAPDCAITGFDLWMPNYAGMPNPGPDFVRGQMATLSLRGPLELISGDSHQTVPKYFVQHPDVAFDLVTVDGDHSEEGARQDLQSVLPRLRIGGLLVLDDIAHPQHRYLEDLWDELVGSQPAFSSFKYRDLGYGVALALRKDWT